VLNKIFFVVRFFNVKRIREKDIPSEYLNNKKKFKSNKDWLLDTAKHIYLKKLKKQYNDDGLTYCSISHSWPYIFFCFSNIKIGVDLEYRKKLKIKEISKIVVNKFSKKDYYMCNSIYSFYDMWTLKEAYFKLTQDKEYLKFNPYYEGCKYDFVVIDDPFVWCNEEIDFKYIEKFTFTIIFEKQDPNMYPYKYWTIPLKYFKKQED